MKFHSRLWRLSFVFAVVAISATGTPGLFAQKYQTVDEAMAVASVYLRQRNFAASREPLEAALELAPDDDFRAKIYSSLMPAYRELPEIQKMQEACEFIMSRSPRAVERSLVRRSYVSFIHQRGKTDEVVRRYEESLKKDTKDRMALEVLAEIYSKLKRDPKKAVVVLERLVELDKNAGKTPDPSTEADLAAELVKAGNVGEGAELFEKLATASPDRAAYNWKEAAVAWQKANNKEKALAAAKKAIELGPDKRSEQLAHYWHRHLGELLLNYGEPEMAIEQLEQAIAKTKIDGYIKDCEKLLKLAKRDAKK